MNKPTDLRTYNRIKEEIWRANPKPSAYRSGLLTKKYKEVMESHGKKPYSGEYKNDSNLARWFSEKWLSDNGQVGYKYKNSVYRPTIRVNSKTPTNIS